MKLMMMMMMRRRRRRRRRSLRTRMHDLAGSVVIRMNGDSSKVKLL